jgi:hypothetical protein
VPFYAVYSDMYPLLAFFSFLFTFFRSFDLTVPCLPGFFLLLVRLASCGRSPRELLSFRLSIDSGSPLELGLDDEWEIYFSLVMVSVDMLHTWEATPAVLILKFIAAQLLS